MFSIFSINVPNSFTASIDGVAVDVQDNKIQWGIQGRENKELEVSYKIGRKTAPPVSKEGTVVVKHLEEGAGKELAPSLITKEHIAENCSTAAENIEGYEVVKIEGQAEGKYIDGSIEVKYIYRKILALETSNKEVNNNVKTPENIVGNNLPK